MNTQEFLNEVIKTRKEAQKYLKQFQEDPTTPKDLLIKALETVISCYSMESVWREKLMNEVKVTVSPKIISKDSGPSGLGVEYSQR